MGSKTSELYAIARQLHITVVGNGYIDWICPKENAELFINEMERLGVRITGFTWWCHVCDGHEPCGLGGPCDEYGNGWYSEICFGDVHEFSCHAQLRRYLFEEFSASEGYRSCFVPAFWLDIKDDP